MARMPTPEEVRADYLQRTTSTPSVGVDDPFAGVPDNLVPPVAHALASRVARVKGNPAAGFIFEASIHCPGPNHRHQDADPSAGLRINTQGKADVNCFAGLCSPEEIAEAVGASTAWSVRRTNSSFAGWTLPPFDGTAHGVDLLHASLLFRQDLVNGLAERGVTREAIDALRLGHVHDGLRERLVFPYWLPRLTEYVGAGLQVPRQQRTADSRTPPKISWSGARTGLVTPWGGPTPGGGPVLVVEGGSSAVAALSLGHQTIGTPYLGWTFYAELVTWLRRYHETEFMVLGDAGEAGREAALKWGRQIRRSVKRVRVLEPLDGPDGYDLADLLADEGADRARAVLHERIDAAQYVEPLKRGPKAGAVVRNKIRQTVLHELRDGREVPYRDLLDLIGGQKKARSLRRFRESYAKEVGEARAIQSRPEKARGEWIWNLPQENNGGKNDG